MDSESMQEIQELNNQIVADPNNAALYYNRGLLYSNARFDSKALENYTSAI